MNTRIKAATKPPMTKQVAVPLASKSRASPVDIDHAVVERRVRKAGMEVIRRDRLPDETGVQYTLLGGGCINVYFTGTCVFGGKTSPGQLKRLKRSFHAR